MIIKNFSLLVKNNLILELRSYERTLLEILTIIVIFLTILLLRMTPQMSLKKSSIRRDINLTDLANFKKLMSIASDTVPYKLYFTPNNKYTQDVFRIASENLKLNGSVGFDTENEMLQRFNAASVLAGVVLQGHNMTLRFPNYFRTISNKNYFQTQDFWLTRCLGVLDSDLSHLDFYEREGFLQLLYTVVRAQMEVERKDFDMLMTFNSIRHNIEAKELNCVNDVNRNALMPKRFLIWSLYYFVYFIPFLNLVWKFSREHEENIFAHHWIYGVSYNVLRLIHFITSLLHFMLLDAIVFTFLRYIWQPLPACKSLLLLAFLIVYNMQLIVYAMILASIVANAKTALWCAVTLWISFYAIFSEVLNTLNYAILKPKTIIISLAFFNNMLPNSFIDYFERGEKNSLTEILHLLAIQFLMLLFYVGTLKCVDHFVSGRNIKMFEVVKYKQDLKKYCLNSKPNLYENNMEFGPLNGEVVELKNVFSFRDRIRKKPLLKNISMKFFKNEISVILGPNGSGKTTLINVLAGWQTYEGDIFYYTHDISQNWSYYQQHIDVCMSNNCLFDLLTVQETVKYFISLKHSHDNQLSPESEKTKWLNIIRPIVTDYEKLVRTLTFGEKRILALICTLVCNTSVVLLHEPTQHMKAEDQTIYWEILKREKHNRVIIVTTLSTDEATEIADRIGILNQGCLTAWGTSYYLRTKFGQGFYLTCFLQPMKPIQPITQLIENFITNFKIKNHFVDRVIYIIPQDKKSIFQRLLIELERKFNTFGIKYIYMAGSSLNDVYMALSQKQELQIQITNIKKNLNFLHEKKPKLQKFFYRTMFYKKLLVQAKNFLPICVILIACFLIIAFDLMSSTCLNVDSIIFSGNGFFQDTGYSTMKILNNNDMVNGIFSFKNASYDYELYEHMGDNNGLAAFEISKPFVSAWFNEEIFHSAPLALKIALKYLRNDSITHINKPINLQSNHDLHIILGTIMPLTMSIGFVALQEERFNSMSVLQQIAGLKERVKWLASFLWDYMIYLLVTVLYVTIIIAYVIDYARWQIVAAAFMLLLLNGLASVLFVYLMSLFIVEDNKFRSFLKIFLLQFALGLFPYILYIHILQNYFESLFYLFMLSPGFSVLHGTNRIFNNNENLGFSSYFEWNYPGILDSLCFISITTFIYLTIFVATIAYRKKYLQMTPKNVKKLASVCYPYDDERVIKEKVRISNMNIKACKAHSILVDQLESKLPKIGNRVNTISFALNKFSCLGIYGTGKSHLLQQLVGEKGYWFGEVYVAGFNCKKQMTKAMKHIGYCPQNAGFNSLLTPREILNMFLMLKGVNESKRLFQIRQLSAVLQLRNFMNTRIHDLPANIKRRINVALVLVAQGEILIFDEPTKGLPAFDRLLIWHIMKYCRSLGNTIVFTSSESDELKELADVVVAVNDGEMLAYDSPHHIEFQYNVGFYLEIKLFADGVTLEEVEENLNTDVENLNRFIMFFHEESELLYRSGSVVKYYIPVENVIYSYVFGSIEKNRHRLNIADYTLTPFSFNNVFGLLQKSRKAKRRPQKSRTSVLKDAKTLPRRD